MHTIELLLAPSRVGRARRIGTGRTPGAGYVRVRMTDKGFGPNHVAIVRLEQGKTLRDLLHAFAEGARRPHG